MHQKVFMYTRGVREQNHILLFSVLSVLSGFSTQFRLPFIWNYPNGFEPKVRKSPTVSYTDVYRTLADLIGYGDIKCNEAPDSVSILNLLRGKYQDLDRSIIHHRKLCQKYFY